MAERTRRSSKTAEARSGDDVRTPDMASIVADGTIGEGPDRDGGSADSHSEGEDSAPATTLSEANQLIQELTADLEAAKNTIRVLLDKAERTIHTDGSTNDTGGAGATIADAVPTPIPVTEDGDSHIHKLMRHQTRALAESEAQLRRKNSELERLNEMKAEFISIAAHELRTPLTSIVGYLDLLKEGRFGKVPEDMERPMASLHRNANRLRRLVDEMLDVSLIEQGQIRLYRVRCDFGLLVEMASEELVSLASEKGVTLTVSIDAPPPIHGDAEKLRQAITKLIGSAIRHAVEGGSITVTVDAAPAEQFAGDWTRLRVRHTGIGLPPHLHSRIFEPFFDVHSAKYHTSSGPDSAGLGLYIARGLVDLHGGLITVESEEGAFLEFTVLLPRSKPSKSD